MMNASNENTVSKLNILSSNTRGFGNLTKQKKMLCHFKKMNADILCLSDTRFNNVKKMLFRNNYSSEYKVYFSSFEGNSRGTLIMVSKKTPILVEGEFSDDDGNMNGINFTYDSKTFTLLSIYGPNSDNPDFFSSIFETCYNQGKEYKILTGDFNTAPSHKLDYKNYCNIAHPRARAELNNMIVQYSCSDAYRFLHGEKIDFTWRAEGNKPQMARLDLCFVSNNLTPFLRGSSIKCAYESDHDFLLNVVDFHRVQRGKGYWKLQNEFLSDNNYIEKIRNTIKETLAKYVRSENYGNFLQECTEQEYIDFMSLCPGALCEKQYNIDPKLLMEMLINDIRVESIGYTVAKRKSENERSSFLYKEMSKLRSKISDGTITARGEEIYNDYRIEYDEIVTLKATKIMQRDKILSKIDGEKASKFFVNLENDKAIDKYIPKLQTETGNVLTRQADIELEIQNFYKNLYMNRDNLISDCSINDFLDTQQIDYPKLDQQESENIGIDITINEMKSALDRCKKGSAPGITGLTYEFYQKFWDLLGHFLVEAANHSWRTGSLPDSLSRGIITLLPKGEKDRSILGNWRPLTMLSTEYKLISACIANRIGKIMPKLVDEDQNGFISGRYIGESIRTVFDTMSYAKSKDITGLLVLIDFKKAFDSLSHSFIFKCLRFFGFNDRLIIWIKILIENFKACTMQYACWKHI